MWLNVGLNDSLFPLFVSDSPLHQVNARNAERALNQEKLESSKLRQR